MTLPVADFLQRWLLHVPVPPDADSAVLWAIPCDADCGSGFVPRGARATAGGGPGGVGLADGVCPAWEGPSRTVSHLWPAARVYRCHLTWRCAPAGAGWGARGMRPRHDRRPGRSVRGVVCLAVARWGPSAAGKRSRRAQRAKSADYGPAGEAVRGCGGRMAGVPRPKLHSVGVLHVRPHPYAVSPTKCSPKCSGPGGTIAGRSPEHSR